MTDTVSHYLQQRVVVEQTWDSDASFMDSFVVGGGQTLSPLDDLKTASLAKPAVVTPCATGTTTSGSGQKPGSGEASREALKARYKSMPKASWFRAAHENRSLGEGEEIT